MRLACRKMPKMREVLSIVHLASAVAKSKHLFVASPLSMMSFSFHLGKSFFESIYPCFFCFFVFFISPLLILVESWLSTENVVLLFLFSHFFPFFFVVFSSAHWSRTMRKTQRCASVMQEKVQMKIREKRNRWALQPNEIDFSFLDNHHTVATSILLSSQKITSIFKRKLLPTKKKKWIPKFQILFLRIRSL